MTFTELEAWTGDIGWLEDEIKEKSKADFIALCANDNNSENSNRWIPVSERLPEIGQYVLCSLINVKDAEHRVIICEYKQEIWWSYVIAWMPLPEPYKESEE